jgi:hypothetical protein
MESCSLSALSQEIIAQWEFGAAVFLLHGPTGVHCQESEKPCGRTSSISSYRWLRRKGAQAGAW